MIPLGFELTVALRFLREGRMQSALIVGGVAVGVAVIYFITAVLVGVQGDLIKRVTGAQPHIVLKPPEEIVAPLVASKDGAPRLPSVQARPQRLITLDGWPVIARQMETTPGVTAVAAVASGAALAIKGDATRAIVLLGSDLDRYQRVVRLDDKLKAGVLRLEAADALMGIELAKDLGAVLGDRFRVQSADGQSDVFQIRGLLDLGTRELNRRYVYVNLRPAQSLLNITGRITNIDAAVDDIMLADRVASRLRAVTGQQIESWIQTNPQVFNAIGNQNIMTLLIRSFITLVVALGISSVLVVSVVQKRKEIGILRAVGATRGQMLRVFLWQGALVGATGALIGTAFGMLLISVFSRILRNPSGEALFTLAFDTRLSVIAFIAATVLGLIAAVLPARNAARLDPAQAIRG
jgi:lipoprotein-releasing system permease protein